MDKIIMYIYAVLCGGMGIVTTLYLVLATVGVLGQKVKGKIAEGKSLFD